MFMLSLFQVKLVRSIFAFNFVQSHLFLISFHTAIFLLNQLQDRQKNNIQFHIFIICAKRKSKKKKKIVVCVTKQFQSSYKAVLGLIQACANMAKGPYQYDALPDSTKRLRSSVNIHNNPFECSFHTQSVTKLDDVNVLEAITHL